MLSKVKRQNHLSRDLMKKLLLFICVINLTAAAQDSTSISFGTETVNEFRKQRLMDEYERAFGRDKNVNTRLKTGLMDQSYANYAPSITPFYGIEQRLTKNTSLIINSFLSNGPGSSLPLYSLFKYRNQLKIALNLEGRYYFSKTGRNMLSGNYAGLEYKMEDQIPKYLEMASSFNLPYYQKKHWAINLGKQFSNTFDLGLQFGIKEVIKPTVSNTWQMSLDPEKSKANVPFIGFFSKIGFGTDLPFESSKRPTNCDFLNCFTEFNTLIKVNLSNLLYLDPYKQNFKVDLSYEKKLKGLPVSLNIDIIGRFSSQKIYKARKQITSPHIWVERPTYYNVKENELQATLSSTLQLRYYFLQNIEIANGKSVSNLSGLYISPGVSWVYYSKTPEKYRVDALGQPFPVAPKLTPKISAGIQKKILKNYYYDISINYRIPTNKSVQFYTGITQDIKFGYAF